MRAIVQHAYGEPEDVLSLEDVPTPEPESNEVLVRVRAASVHPDVWHVVTGRPYVLRAMGAGLRRPRQRIPGTDLSGVVEAVGTEVTEFRPGDEVMGETIKGMQWVNGGAYAEYAAVHPEWLAPKPASLTFEQAACLPTAGIIALFNMRPGKVEPGKKVLVNGAAGGVGHFAVQIAKALGAEVTGVDHTDRLELLRGVGADHVLDYTKDDFTQGNERYDFVFDVPGNHPFGKVRRVLTHRGVYVVVGHDGYGRAGRWFGSIPKVFRLMARSPFSRHIPKPDFSTPNKHEALTYLSGLVNDGKLTPVVGQTFPLAQTAEALRFLASGQGAGRVVVA